MEGHGDRRICGCEDQNPNVNELKQKGRCAVSCNLSLGRVGVELGPGGAFRTLPSVPQFLPAGQLILSWFLPGPAASAALTLTSSQHCP